MPEQVFEQMKMKKNSENAREFSLQDAYDSALRAHINHKKVYAYICLLIYLWARRAGATAERMHMYSYFYIYIYVYIYMF